MKKMPIKKYNTTSDEKKKFTPSKENDQHALKMIDVFDLGNSPPMTKYSTGVIRTDIFGNIISKENKNYKVTFGDQTEKGKLVDIILIDDKQSVNNHVKITSEISTCPSPKKPIENITIPPSYREERYKIKRPRKKRSLTPEERKLLENDRADVKCCSIL